MIGSLDPVELGKAGCWAGALYLYARMSRPITLGARRKHETRKISGSGWLGDSMEAFQDWD